jgi:acetolactate synthase regulatory subunit
MNSAASRVANHRLTIEFSGVEGAFLRILGLMERRGYRLQTCTLNRRPDGRCVVDVVVESDRPGDLLKRQLERLYDVDEVHLKAPRQPPRKVRRINIGART